MKNPRTPLIGIGVAAAAFALLAAPAHAQTAAPSAAMRALEIKYVRDSQEYATVSRMVYRLATRAVTDAAKTLKPQSWVVILDIDETALDNTPSQLDRAAYDLPFDPVAFVGWVNRREASPVPGAVEFVAAVRKAGGRIAWISNRLPAGEEGTRDNLKRVSLWTDDDRLCLADSARPKRARRTEVISGSGACSWTGIPMNPVAFIGDQMGDFPEPNENVPGTGTDDAFGTVNFLLPNPMYGDWTSRVTRTR